jgi:hypothetical protein
MNTLNPCPHCDHQPEESNLRDSVHPVDRERTVWTAGCLASEGGCDSYSLGDSREGAINNWNTRVVRSTSLPAAPSDHTELLEEALGALKEDTFQNWYNYGELIDDITQALEKDRAKCTSAYE